MRTSTLLLHKKCWSCLGKLAYRQGSFGDAMSHFETTLLLELNNVGVLRLLSRSDAMMSMKIWNDEYDSEEDDFWNDDETEGAQLCYKEGYLGEKIASVVVVAIDIQLLPREGSY